ESCAGGLYELRALFVLLGLCWVRSRPALTRPIPSRRLIGIGASPAIVDLDIAPLNPAEIFQTLPQRRHIGLRLPIAFRVSYQHANSVHACALLSACGDGQATAPPSSETKRRRDPRKISHRPYPPCHGRPSRRQSCKRR